MDDLIVPNIDIYTIVPNIEGAGEEDAIFLTRTALEEIRHITAKSVIIEEFFLRISSGGGGTKGFYFKLDFDSELEENDRIFFIEDQKIVIDAKTLFYLMGVTIDWASTDEESGFIFKFEGDINN
ncbi:MAG TPA: hypothetical protein PKY56_13405 [Candidatus Kapabacteria bacterium]|nr:hypothetical protein [Candidatus Kapabacteria bacterium]